MTLETTRAGTLLGCYEALEQTSREMVLAARSGDWDRVARLEGVAGGLIEQLRARLRSEPLGADATREKLRILRRIIVNDGEVRCLAQPWLRRLDALLRGGDPADGPRAVPGGEWSGSWSDRLH